MTTIKFTYKNKSKDVYQNDAFVEKNSAAPESLAEIIREIDTLTCDLSIATAPWDGTQRLISYVRLGYNGRVLQFDFYHSIRITEEFTAGGLDSDFLKNILYTLLRTIKSDAGIHELDFDEFCNEYGYDQEINDAYTTYDQACDFSSNIARVFSDEEIESFPC